MKKTDRYSAHEEKRAPFGRILLCSLIACMLLLAIPVGAAEAVSFPDTDLEAAVRDALDKPRGDITTDDMAGLGALDAEDKGISDLSGLEHAVNLRGLDLDSNEISDLGPLAGLTDL
ncbi:MAG TPA: hypothetical protein PLI54_06160, partial [Methanoculleus sp.]|nr:hypothetical protein [Methanoculleus sp.]